MNNSLKDNNNKEEKNDSFIQNNSIFNFVLEHSDCFNIIQNDNNRLSSYDYSSVPLLINNPDRPLNVDKIEKTSNEIHVNNFSSIKKFKIKKRNNDIINYKDKKENKKKLGRKRKNDNSKGDHNKYSDDNLRIKCKFLVLKSVMDFINTKIKFLYNDDIGNSIFKKQLLTNNSNQISNSKVKFNKDFLNKSIGQIYSDDISTKFSNYPLDHNKNLIKRLENEEDEEKREYFKNLFKLTFLQCLKHYRGTEIIKELDGLKCINEIKAHYYNEKEYEEKLSFYLMNYENIINGKKSRKNRK